MRTLAFTILTMSVALAAGQAPAQTYGPGFYAPGLMRTYRIATACKGATGAIPAIANISSYAQCMATASGTFSYCGVNPHYAFALQRRGDYRPPY